MSRCTPLWTGSPVSEGVHAEPATTPRRGLSGGSTLTAHALEKGFDQPRVWLIRTGSRKRAVGGLVLNDSCGGYRRPAMLEGASLRPAPTCILAKDRTEQHP